MIANPMERQPTAVAYYRVSTKGQGASGLGLEAQKRDVAVFCQAHGYHLVDEYTEVESGAKNDRPVLQTAIRRSTETGSKLLVAKLDRLTRDLAMMVKLRDSGIDFIACDMPEANRFTVAIHAAIAEHERELISERQKKACAAAKRRGVLLGSARPGHWEGREERRRIGQKKAVKESARRRDELWREYYAPIIPRIRRWLRKGATYKEIASKLNSTNTLTRKGTRWTGPNVQRVIVVAGRKGY